MKRKACTVILKCSECGFETPSRRSLEDHVIEKHLELVENKSVQKRAKTLPHDGKSSVVILTQEDCLPSRRSRSTSKLSQPQLTKSGFTENPTPHTSSSAPVVVNPPQHVPQLDSQFSNRMVFACQLCDYWCENQRAIKAHMWKHSGHKNLQYPSFQISDTDTTVQIVEPTPRIQVEKPLLPRPKTLLVSNSRKIQPTAKKRCTISPVEEKALVTQAALTPQTDVKPELQASHLPIERSVSEQSAAALLTLLHHGRYDESMTQELPSSDTSNSLELPSQNASVTSSTVSSPSSEPTKQKTGICSSLLAVIEQLHDEASDAPFPPGGASPDGLSGDCEVLPGNHNCLPDDIEVCTQPSGYRCKICQLFSSKKSTVLLHLSIDHKQSLWQRGQFPCSLCSYEGKSFNDLQTHTLSHCTSKGFRCHHCEASFVYKSQLRAHTSQLHSLVQIQAGFICSTCFTKNPLPRDFHPNSCPVVECRSCRNPLNLSGLKQNNEPRTLQLNGESDPIPEISSEMTPLSLVCYQCDFIAINTRSLKSHLKRHENDRRYVTQPLQQYKCNICGYVCHHPPSLKSHMWRHAGEATFNYSFHAVIDDADGNAPRERSIEVNNNNMAALTKKPLVTLRCCQCGFETVYKDVLNHHMTSHQDIIDNTFSLKRL